MLGPHARLIYAEDAAGSIGRKPAPELEIDGATYVAAFRQADQAANRKTRRGE